jgi:chromosome segregation ATPase
MNTTPPDTPEEVTDIFVLTRSQPGSSDITDDLKESEYRVTLFDDGLQLLEALEQGKPNLLICDTTTFGEEGFEICRQIKAAKDFWMIPVLVLTGATDLGDLLRVLDCNADNLLSTKSSPGYLPMLIEGMLATPVERQTQDLVKTQFKIQHNDRIYVVMAGRRKLLEMLLSAYEIVVGKTQTLEQALADLSDMTRRAGELEEEVRDHTGSIEKLNETLRQRDEQERQLHAELAVKEAALKAKDVEIERLGADIDGTGKRLHDADERIRSMIKEQEKLIAAHRAETEDLGQQIQHMKSARESLHLDLGRISDELEEKTNSLSEAEERIRVLSDEKDREFQSFTAKIQEYEQKTDDLAKERDSLAGLLRDVNDALTEEKSLREAREVALTDLAALKETLGTRLAEVVSELETLRETKDTETSRADAAEKLVDALHEAQEKSEQDQVRALAESGERAKMLSAEIQRLNNGVGEATARAVSAEERVAVLEKEHGEASAQFALAEEALTKAADESQNQYETIVAALEERGVEIRTLENDLLAAHEKNTELETANKGFADQIALLMTDRDKFSEWIRSLETDLSGANERKRDLETSVESLTGQVALLTADRDKSSEQVRSLEQELALAREQAADEKARHDSVKEQLAAAIEDHAALAQVHTEKQQVAETGIAAHREEIGQLKADITAQAALKAELENDLSTAVARQKSLEAELSALHKEKGDIGQSSQTLADELEILRISLETEQRLHRLAEDRVEQGNREKYRLDTDLKNVRGTLVQIQGSLDRERTRRESAEEAAKKAREKYENALADLPRPNASEDLEQEIARLKEELNIRKMREESLEQQVQALTVEKMHVEQKVETLDTEIQDARIALADEWEDHMNTGEELAAVIEMTRQAGDVPERTAIRPGHAVVPRHPDLPVVRSIESHSMTKFDAPPSSLAEIPEKEVLPVLVRQEEDLEAEDPARVPITSMEDLLEPEPAGADNTTGTPGSDDEPVPAAVPDDEPVLPEPEEESADIAEPVTAPVRAQDSRSNIPFDGISFNRQQWLDLLKWAHHSGALSQEQRMQIVRMGRLIQRGRKLTQKQDEQVRDMLSLVQTLGYRFP